MERPAMPPTMPPTIAPMGVEEWEEEEEVAGWVVVEGAEIVAPGA
jgi:hypothetical protein